MCFSSDWVLGLCLSRDLEASSCFLDEFFLAALHPVGAGDGAAICGGVQTFRYEQAPSAARMAESGVGAVPYEDSNTR